MLSCHLLSKFGSGASNNNMEHAKVRSGNALSMLKGISADQEERTAGWSDRLKTNLSGETYFEGKKQGDISLHLRFLVPLVPSTYHKHYFVMGAVSTLEVFWIPNHKSLITPVCRLFSMDLTAHISVFLNSQRTYEYVMLWTWLV